MNNMQDLPSRLKEIRKKNHFSQEQLAEKLNISRQAISGWENGKSAPDLENLMLLAELYHVSMDELMGGNKAEREVVPEKNVVENNLLYYLEIVGVSVILLLLAQFPIIPSILSLVVAIWYKVKKRGHWIVYVVCVFCFIIGAYNTLAIFGHLILNYGTTSLTPA